MSGEIAYACKPLDLSRNENFHTLTTSMYFNYLIAHLGPTCSLQLNTITMTAGMV